MAEQQTFRMRITFAKQGRLALLSHLEIARALERAVRRAQLPFAVSQGFSPHMKIAFGAALPVGVGGTHEMVDLQLVRYVRPDEALAALQAASASKLSMPLSRSPKKRARPPHWATHCGSSPCAVFCSHSVHFSTTRSSVLR